jgi:PEP-CTERM/exosortase A-associated glycosyltransferase
MRVLHVLDHSLPLHSGYAFRTVAILRESRARGWETLQLTTPRHRGGAREIDEVDGWTYHRTSMRDGAGAMPAGVTYLREMAATRRRLRELAAAFKPDVIHAHSPLLNAFPAIAVARRAAIPVVYEVRALWEDAAVDHGTTREGSVRYRLSRALETAALRRVDHVTTICEGLRREIARRGIAEDRITVVPNAVDADAFRSAGGGEPTLRTALGLDGATVIGFAGSFYGYEGLDLLIEALALLAERRPDVRALLVGGGPQEPVLRRLAADSGVGSRVVFAGRIPHPEVPRYYDLIDVLVYPRRRIRLTELVTPLKPLEAMAQGRMLVASDVGGHAELIRDGETGFLVPAGDARALARRIDEVLARRAEWPRLRERARRFIESERTWARSVARYAAVYDAVRARGSALVEA